MVRQPMLTEIRCDDCGARMAANAAACPACGAAVDPTELCPRCGIRLPPEAETCTACGIALACGAAPEPGVAVVRDLVVVYSGSRERVLPLQAALADAGIRAFVPDLHLKSLDPFATGGNPLGYDLRVAADQANAARAAIARLSPAPTVAPDTGTTDGGTPAAEGAARTTATLERDGTRIRWWAVAFVMGAPVVHVMTMQLSLAFDLAVAAIATTAVIPILGAPVTLFLGPRYVMATFGRRPRPRHHALTWAAMLLVAVVSVVAAFCGAIVAQAYAAWIWPGGR